MAKLTQAQLDKWLRKWQGRLKLADWRIKIDIRRGHVIGDVDALCAPTLTRKIAHISIADPVDTDDTVWESDHEQSVVHELIHCHFDPFFPKDPKSMEYISAEQAVDALATAFVELDRARKS